MCSRLYALRDAAIPGPWHVEGPVNLAELAHNVGNKLVTLGKVANAKI